MKSERIAGNGRLASQLAMGDRSGVSRGAADALAGRREAALEIRQNLDSQLNE